MRSSFGRSTMEPVGVFAPPPKKPHHNVLHNLLKDAIDTAKGIPFGMVELARNPVKSVKLMGQSYADTYGHGWGHFKTEFMAHPLQPLLDAISIPLILAGGVGVAVKGASFAANVGKDAGMLAKASKLAGQGKWAEADAMRAAAMPHPRLDKAAQRFRKGTSATTRMVKVESMPGLSLPKAYSSNLFRRALTKGTSALLERSGVGYFGAAHLGERMLVKEESKRAAATAAAGKGQASVLMGAKKADLDPSEVINRLGDDLEFSLQQNALMIPVAHAEELSKSRRFKDFQFIQKKDAERVEAEIFDPDEFAGVERIGPERQLTAGEGKLTRGDEPEVDSGGYKTRIEVTEEGAATRRLHMKGYAEDQILAAIKTMGKRVKTTDDHNMALVKDGNVLVVRKGIADDMLREMEDSAKLARLITRAPVQAWKGFILGMSPRYFVNNVIGNAGMWAASTNPVEFTRGTLSAIKQVRGNRAAAKAAKEMESTLDHLMAKYMPNDWVHQRFGYLQHGALGLEQTAGMRTKGALRRAAHARLYTVTEQVAYRGPQRSALMGVLHTDGDFRNLYREYQKQGISKERAYRKAVNTILHDQRKVAAFEKRVTDWSGQYYHLNALEKKITAFVPFYTWDRHALRFGKEQVLSRPVSTFVYSQLGAMGDKAADRELGRVPDFMKGAIPVDGRSGGILGFLLGQNIQGRKKILLSSGLNPLAAAADNADAIAGMFGMGSRDASESVGGKFNPLISGAIAGVTGQRLFSGAKTQYPKVFGKEIGGPVGGAIEETFVQLPHAKLIGQALGKSPPTKTSKGGDTLYMKDMRQTISSLFGLNERDFSPEAAERLWRQDHGIKKPRRKARRDVSKLKSSLKSNF